MKIQCDKEAVEVISKLADLALRQGGLAVLPLVNSVNTSTTLFDDKNSKNQQDTTDVK